MTAYETYETKIHCLLLAGLTLLAGCIPSLNAVYTEETLDFDPALVGTWQQPGAKARWEFSKLDDKSYRLIYTDEEGQQGRFIGRLAKLDGESFLDLFPEDIEMDAVGFYKFHLVPIHTIYRLQRPEGKLKLSAIDFQWLDKYLNDHPGEIQYATFSGRKLITAPTASVQTFVLAHKDQFTGNFELQKLEANN
ncbi:MAG TPA: hypothetical protein VFV87_10010 [Pirellulaceae bacterium]|nr:hypothetical protein [Pirellulaceae bacterium]